MNKLIKQAFTLIELLVVIAIIGILSGLIVVSMSGVTQKATIAKAQVFSNSLRNSLMLSLVSEWKFDEGSGTTTVDSWNNNIGTLVGASHLPIWKTEADCVYKNCIQFDSSEDYINGASPSISGDYSIEAWAKMDSAAGGSTRTLIAWYSGPRFNITHGATNKPLIYLNTANYRYGSTNYADGKWHHWYFVIIGSARTDILSAKIYIDGKEDAYGISSSSVDPLYPSSTLAIGTYAYSLIDNLRIYDSIISTSQIKENYYLGLNKMLNNGIIDEEEYISRINNLIAKNELN
ncbi:prepilin-type N-terminal cleavage/methylation domain-containing protein [bacterium]|jgi:prepilin-type N-terminal cleavage/methylation domain-containing protein|nr:prepilin-type N-terminal cleavage/methylation domain-containing protein [bacterium]